MNNAEKELIGQHKGGEGYLKKLYFEHAAKHIIEILLSRHKSVATAVVSDNIIIIAVEGEIKEDTGPQLQRALLNRGISVNYIIRSIDE